LFGFTPAAWPTAALSAAVVFLPRRLLLGPVKTRTIVRVLAASSQVQHPVTQVNFYFN